MPSYPFRYSPLPHHQLHSLLLSATPTRTARLRSTPSTACISLTARFFFSAIFRWITVKDLNQMEFVDSQTDTPMGLLRGIKFGTETYHVLFMRLCRLV